MNLLELSKYLLDEEAAEQYLLDNGILKNFVECPYCKSQSIGKIRRGRMKCYKCKKEWHRRRSSILESKHISSSLYVGLIKLVSTGVPSNQIVKELDLDYKTVIELVQDFKISLVKYCFNDSFLQSKKYILSEHMDSEIVQVDVWCRESEEKLLTAGVSFGQIELVRTKAYDDTLSFTYLYKWVFRLKRRKIYNIDRFFSFFKERVAVYRGVSYERFSEYFLESIIRFNYSDNYFQCLLSSIHHNNVKK